MRIVVAGALANKPRYGGEAWVRLAWLRGLRRLGAEVAFVERLGDPGGAPDEPAPGVPLDFFGRVRRQHLGGIPCFLLDGRGATLAGGTEEEAADRATEADLLINVSGHLRPGDPVFEAARRRVYVDLDPGYTQFWHAAGVGALGLERHDHHFTVGWNVGRSRCALPDGGLQWVPLRQPVVLDDWPATPLPDGFRLTTVAAWRGAFGPVEVDGRRFGLKVHEFRKVMELPGDAPLPLEIALDIHPADGADRRRLVDAGWWLADPVAAAGTPDAFRRYVQASGGEFSVAQGIYVDTESGWFSDRSARYLASGRPVVIQDTGMAPDLPVDEGILAFRTPDEARAALERLVEDPERHARAARALAEEVFDSDRVLAGVLERVSEPRAPRSAAVGRTPSRRLRILVSGMIASVPGQGGAAWAVLQYLLGLEALGHEVHFVEEIAGDEVRGTPGAALTESRNWAYLRTIAHRYGLAERVTLLRRERGDTAGRSRADLIGLARRCDLVVNLSGRLRDPEVLDSVPVRLYVDLDPAFTQLWHRDGAEVGLEGHTHFATVGLSLGGSDCPVPTCGRSWIPTLPPVVLDHWPAAESVPERDAWTTVSHWRGYGSVELNGSRLGQKVHSFRDLFPLPERAGDRFDVALAIHPGERDDLKALRRHGWRLLDPDQVAGDPWDYRDFVAGSAGELGVAKAGYVQSRSGWFSDRSAAYLASGRPVVAQDTGFGTHVPVGEGLLAFADLEEAGERVRAVRCDYARHARAARRFAEEHLDAARVLGTLIRAV